MSIIARMRKQTCVYWPPAAEPFDDYGQPQYGDAVEMECRWEDKAEEFIGPAGTTETSKSKVFVESDVEPGGVLLLGEIESGTDLTVPKNNEGAWEIKAFNKTPNLKATEFLRTAYL